VKHPHLTRERAAHDQPHDDLSAFGTTKLGILSVSHRGECFWMAFEQVEKAVVPLGVVEAGAFAVHLMRQTACRDDRNREVLVVALDRAGEPAAEVEASAGCRNRILQHAHLQWDDSARPPCAAVGHHRQGREHAVVDRLVSEERDVELVGHQ
jgi:hypothetical protein